MKLERGEEEEEKRESKIRPRMFFVMGIMTAFSSRKRRDSIRGTWFPKGKQAYRWLGSESIAEKGSSLFNSDEPKKPVFGREITNLRAKRSKTDCSSNRKQIVYKKHDEENTEQESKPVASNYVFGPFSPTGASKKNNNVEKGRFQEIETLASIYKPQYCNKELTGIFGHFAEAWNQWHAELDRK